MVPAPGEPKAALSRLAASQATASFRLAAFVMGPVERANSSSATWETGARSFSGS